ncbi:MAG: response regulator [Elusimicrobiales bacterium]|nr:response regulator [Elusimicrobiales bacterium]
MKKVLILEDEQDYVNVLTQLLEPEGFKIVAAGTVKDALNLIEMIAPDLLIVDWNLPDGTGLEFIKEVRAQKKFRKVRIVMNSIRDAESDQLAAYMEHVDFYFTKPIKPEIFLGKIKKILDA